MMGEILFLAHRMPFPPDRGDKIRSHHLLRALADTAAVHVACFGDTDTDFAHESELAAVASTHCLIRRSKSMVQAGLEALVSGKPVSLTAFDHHDIHKWVERTLREQNIQTIVVFSGQMGQYIPAWFKGRVVVDLCDVDSAKFEAYAQEGFWPRRWIDAREGKLLSQVEEALSNRADTTVLISDVEVDLFRSRISDAATHHVTAIRNGIDFDFFDPSIIKPEPTLATSKGPNIVFTGQMDYAPNIGAAIRVMDRILPRIRQEYPDAVFHLVGRAPVNKLTARDGKDGIRVWGEVPDVRPFLAGADVVMAPLEIARGVQNKVLEAMAMARPVVLSKEAATGIDAADGEHFVIGSDDAELIAATLDLLSDGPKSLQMASAARRYVTAEQSWPAMLAPLAGICGFQPSKGQRNAA